MRRGPFEFWIALPAAAEDLGLLESTADAGTAYVDLRYGDAAYRERMLRALAQAGLPDLAVCLDLSDDDALSLARSVLPGRTRIILDSPYLRVAAAGPVIEGLRADGFRAGCEARDADDASRAFEAGAAFLTGSTAEAGGLVSPQTAPILTQQVHQASPLPAFVRGSVGPMGAAALYAAGCQGCVLDSQLLLVPESPLPDEWREPLNACSPFDTALVGDLVGCAYRAYASRGREELERLKAKELSSGLAADGGEDLESSMRMALAPHLEAGLSAGAVLPPVGQGIAFATRFARDGMGVADVLDEYERGLADCVDRLRTSFPFTRNSDLAREHGVEFPIVQGPMAGVSESPALAGEVLGAGALPFIATGGMSGADAESLIRETAEALDDGPFGVGLIGFIGDVDGPVGAVRGRKPRFVTIAGGTAEHALTLESEGIACYLHVPSPAHLGSFLDAGVSRLILEGHEAGGHVGSLGALVLWELATEEMLSRGEEQRAELRVLFAGGIASPVSSLMAGVFGAALKDAGAAVGLQLGTAYLTTPEAVQCGAVGEHYARALARHDYTVVTGRTVNLPARWLLSFEVRQLFVREQELAEAELPFQERKNQVEALAREHINAAVGDELVGDEWPACMAGQAVGLLDGGRTMAGLHAALTDEASRLARRCSIAAPHQAASDEPIAIVGMGCRFPDASSAEQYWQNLVGCHSSIGDVPRERWDPDLYYDPEGKLDNRTRSKLGAFIKDFEPDPVRFRIPPVSAPAIDGVQFMALEVAAQTLEDAGYLDRDFPRERTGVILGNSMGGEKSVSYTVRACEPDYEQALVQTANFQSLPGDTRASLIDELRRNLREVTPDFTEDSCPGMLGSLIAGRICNYLDLGGVSFTLDGACASSLAAVNTAMQGLRSGQFDMVLAGGAETRMDPACYMMFSSLGVLSDKGSFPFDERADGFVMGEGVGMVLLKRLTDAVRDGDHVYAIIRSAGSSSDGSVKGITAPDPDGQAMAMERAYAGMPFTPADISLVEAHGTATWTGDITELTSLSKVFGRAGIPPRSVGLGSVKSMIGHLKTAAGIAGLIKIALALQNKVLPPTLNCEQPRRDYDWESSPFYLVDRPRTWNSDGGPRRGAVNSFGFGGVNFHIVLEEAESAESLLSGTESGAAAAVRPPARLLALRAPSREQLLAEARDLAARAEGLSEEDLRTEARARAERLSRRGLTLAVLATDGAQLRRNLEKAIQVIHDGRRTEFASAQGIYFGSEPPEEMKIAFLYPGQGSQYVGMGRGLMGAFPFLTPAFRAVGSASRAWTGHSGLEPVVAGEDIPEEEREALREAMVHADRNHPALTAMWVALTAFMRRAGIRPDMAAGHSVGEYGALYAAGVFNLHTAVAVTSMRGMGIESGSATAGAMAAVAGPAEEVEPLLEQVGGTVLIANKNCPAQTVISGETASVEAAVKLLNEKGRRAALLPVSGGFHTPLMEGSVHVLRDVLVRLPIREPSIPVMCNLTGSAYPVVEDFRSEVAEKLGLHLTRPVEFISNVEEMYDAGARLFIELGPGSTLCSFVDSILGSREHWTIPTNLPRSAPALQLMHALAFCVARGVPVDLAAVLDPQAEERPRALRRRAVGASRTEGPRRGARSAAARSDFLREALGEVPDASLRRYLESRKEFLKALVRLDFEHHSGTDGTAGAPGAVSGDGVSAKVVDIVARKTGYPADVIDMDQDMEAELGLDSIKQAEIVRELESEFQVRLRGDREMALRHIATLNDVVDVIRAGLTRSADGGEAGEQEPLVVDEAPEPTWNTDCFRHVCRLQELPPLGDETSGAMDGKIVVVLGDDGELARGLAEGLEDRGARVTVCAPAEVDSGLPAHFDVIVDSSSFGDDSPALPGNLDDWWLRIREQSLAGLRVARRAVASARREEAERVLWAVVTSTGGELGARAVDGTPAAAGPSLGLCRGAYADHTDLIEPLFIDFEAGIAAGDVADAVVTELSNRGEAVEIGYRNGRRFEIRWVPEALECEDAAPLPEGSVVLAVGGARGITASMCRALVRACPVHVIAVGRSPFEGGAPEGEQPLSFEKARERLLGERAEAGEKVVPAEIDRRAWRMVWNDERQRNMADMREHALSVEYRQCDVTDLDAARDLVREVIGAHGRIDLVVNGTGALVERTVEEFEDEQFVAGLRPKALGTAALLAALEDVDLEAFVNVSSIVGRWGHMGLAAYAVGHVTASMLVAGRRGRSEGRWMNQYYGPWLHVGMTRLGSTMERISRSGGAFVAEADGAGYFVEELACSDGESSSFMGGRPFGILRARPSRPVEHPLLQEVVISQDGRALGRGLVDPAHDRFAGEHSVRFEPLLPATVTFEVLAQTAAALAADDLELTEIADAELLRPIRFPRGEPREVATEARVVTEAPGSIWLEARVFSEFVPPDGSRVDELDHARCRLHFGSREPGPEPSVAICTGSLTGTPVEMSEFWETFAACGRQGVFRNVASVQALGPDGIAGVVAAAPSGVFGGWAHTGNPIRMDGLMYLSSCHDVFWTGNPGHVVHSIGSIRFYKSGGPDEPRRVNVLSLGQEDDVLRFELEAVDRDGCVCERVTGLVLARAFSGEWQPFDYPIAERLRCHPERAEVARLLGLPDPVPLSGVPVALVESAAGSDGHAFIERWLSPVERQHYAGLEHEKRRREWLAGRCAAKAALRYLPALEDVPASEIAVVSDENGVPRVEAPGTESADVLVTIAHTADRAVAGASKGIALGVDLEHMTEEIEGIADQFCMSGEADLVASAAELDRRAALMTIWVLKEAALKVIGAHNCLMKELKLTEASREGDYVVGILCAADRPDVRAVSLTSGECFYAVATTADQPECESEDE